MDDALFDATHVSQASARISDDGRYRYTLERLWDPDLPLLVFVMLNPSTADALVDDPTIRRCVGFAKALKHGGIRVVNLYAYRATDPDLLAAAGDPIGPENDDTLQATFANAAEYGPGTHVIAAWGGWRPGRSHWPVHARRIEFVTLLATTRSVTLHALHVTAGGSPGHPLYLPATARPVPWPPREDS